MAWMKERVRRLAAFAIIVMVLIVTSVAMVICGIAAAIQYGWHQLRRGVGWLIGQVIGNCAGLVLLSIVIALVISRQERNDASARR